MKYLKVKTIILLIVMGSISYSALGQKNSNIPQPVVAAFSAKYPQAQLKNWKTSHEMYIASFSSGNKKYKAFFSKDGIWLTTERNINKISGLPVELRSYLKTSKFASWHIDDMKRVRTPLQNMYQVKVDNHSGSQSEYEGVGSAENKLLCFDDKGKLLSAKDY